MNTEETEAALALVNSPAVALAEKPSNALRLDLYPPISAPGFGPAPRSTIPVGLCVIELWSEKHPELFSAAIAVAVDKYGRPSINLGTQPPEVFALLVSLGAVADHDGISDRFSFLLNGVELAVFRASSEQALGELYERASKFSPDLLALVSKVNS